MPTTSHRLVTTVDELGAPLISARMSPMPIRPGALRAEWTWAELGGPRVELCEHLFSVATRRETGADRIVFLTPSRHFVGWLDGESAEVGGATEGPAQMAIISFPRPLLERTATELGLDVVIPSAGELWTIGAADRVLVERSFATVARMVRCGPVEEGAPRAAALGVALAEACARSLAVDRAGRPATPSASVGSVGIAVRCEEHAVDARFQGLTMAGLCRASGRSERRVRQAFYDCYGVSPFAYLRIAALHATRGALLHKAITRDVVSRTASDFGFWHLSRFAGQYRALFGESPSATILRRRHAAASATTGALVALEVGAGDARSGPSKAPRPVLIAETG